VVCGMKVSASSQSNAKAGGVPASTGYKTTLNVSGGKVLQLSAEEAASVSASKLTNLRNSKRLALVLDLDHTLLHAIQVEGQTPSRTAATARVIDGTTGIGSGDGTEDNLVHHLPIEEIDRLTVKHLVMKKRPFLDEFLEKASEFCQMTVYTAGTRRYAEAVARVIDPSRRYFADRIVSRDDVAGIRADGNDKSLERIYPGDASMAVIIDDREDVWRGAQSAQLLLVRPFQHFDPRPCEAAAAAAAAAGAPLTPSDNAVSPLPDALGTVSRGVTQPHAPAPNGSLPEVVSPIITLCGTQSGQAAGRILRVAPLYTFAHSSGDDQLQRCLQVLTQIHAEYYGDSASASSSADKGAGFVESKESNGGGSGTGGSVSSASHSNPTRAGTTGSTGPDGGRKSVAGILTELKRRVLAGCTVTFSGLIPTNEENPRNHMLWRLAESLGAQVSVLYARHCRLAVKCKLRFSLHLAGVDGRDPPHDAPDLAAHADGEGGLRAAAPRGAGVGAAPRLAGVLPLEPEPRAGVHLHAEPAAAGPVHALPRDGLHPAGPASLRAGRPRSSICFCSGWQLGTQRFKCPQSARGSRLQDSRCRR
jgi:FCP1-like phosphatase family protein